MTNAIYIDVPADGTYQYDWSLGPNAHTVVRKQENINGSVKFICNRIAKMSNGDIYELIFNDPRELTVFLLKSKFKLVNSNIVQKYITDESIRLK